MLKKMMIAGLLVAAGVQQAAADGKVYVKLPDLSSYTGQRAEEFLQQIVLANVVSGNCPDFAVTDAEWSLLTDSADILAYGQLKIDSDVYDENYYNPAFAALDQAGTCAEKGPEVEQVLNELVAQGGSREPLPDQEGAYEEWRAYMDKLQGITAEPVKTKTK